MKFEFGGCKGLETGLKFTGYYLVLDISRVQYLSKIFLGFNHRVMSGCILGVKKGKKRKKIINAL